MRLLVITQKVDKNDAILGFFHRWLEEFAKNCDFVTVVCLQKGEYCLPSNVRILSLGKERHSAVVPVQLRLARLWTAVKLGYLINFYKYIWQERKNYDTVFVHMNQEYILLGGMFWKLVGKKIFLWRNHPKGGILCRLAVFLSNTVFCTSKFAFVARYKKTKIMPVGIDTEMFREHVEIKREPRTVFYLGRISPVKKIDILIEAVKILKDKGIMPKVKIMGDAPERDKEYGDDLRKKVLEYGLKNFIDFENGVPNFKTPEIYNKYEIFVNLTPTGSMDKTIFEAMACGSIVLISNRSLLGQIDERLFFQENNSADLSNKIEKIFLLDSSEKKIITQDLRNFVDREHSLKKLINSIFIN